MSEQQTIEPIYNWESCKEAIIYLLGRGYKQGVFSYTRYWFNPDKVDVTDKDNSAFSYLLNNGDFL